MGSRLSMLLVAAALAALAWSSAGVALPPTPGTHVHMQNFAFSPQNIQVSAGGTVTWDNHDAAPHTATDLLGGFSSGSLGRGASYSHTFAIPGVSVYQCTIHLGMIGVVTVLP